MSDNKLPMQFKALHVYKYAQLQGSIEVEGPAGKVTLNLTDAEIAVIMGVCADSLVRISGEAAERMREAIMGTVRGESP